MLTLAICLAVLAACCFSRAVHLQHRAVRAATTEATLGLSGIKSLATSGTWLSGFALIVLGGALHIVALAMAPLAIIQPIGILSLIFTVLAASRASRTMPSPAVLAAVLLSAGGMITFVVLSARNATTAEASASHTGPAQIVAGLALLLALVGLRTKSAWRCPTLALASALFFGFGAALIRASAQDIVHLGVAPLSLLVAFESLASLTAGAWIMHQAYAPTAVTVAATNVLDPITAVGIGIALYGEATHTTAPMFLAEFAAGTTAIVGVLLLAKHFPDQSHAAEEPEVEIPLDMAA